MQRSWMTCLMRLLLWTVPGVAVLGSSCAADLKNAVVSAGLDFVEDSVGEALNTLIPVGDVLAGATGT